MSNWTKTPTLTELLKRLNDLMTRMARLQALQQLERTHAALKALANKDVK